MSKAVLDKVNRRILRIESGEYNPQTVVKKSSRGLVLVKTENAPRSRYSSGYLRPSPSSKSSVRKGK